MRGLIYKVTHRESGRVYIGQTVHSIAARWRSHQRQTYCVLLHRAIQKYGVEAFSVEQIGVAGSKLQLDMLERFWISVHQATDRAFGFNLREGGSFGRLSDETRKRMSESMQIRGKDPAYRKKLSEAQKGRKVSDHTRARLIEANTGKKPAAETIGKLSEARRALWQDPAYRAAVTAAQTAGKRTPEAREAAAAKTRAQWADPEQRKQKLEAMAAGKARAKATRERA